MYKLTKSESLQREYDQLAARCGEFTVETTKLLRRGDEQRKQWIADRKALHQRLIAEKGVIAEKLRAALAEEKADEAEKIAEEALKPDVETLGPSKAFDPSGTNVLQPGEHIVVKKGETIERVDPTPEDPELVPKDAPEIHDPPAEDKPEESPPASTPSRQPTPQQPTPQHKPAHRRGR